MRESYDRYMMRKYKERRQQHKSDLELRVERLERKIEMLEREKADKGIHWENWDSIYDKNS